MSQQQTETSPNPLNFQQEPPTKHPSNPIYVLTLEFDKAPKKEIPIYPNSNPGELAFDFCKKNHLNFDSLKKLENQIEQLIKQHSHLKLIHIQCTFQNHLLPNQDKSIITSVRIYLRFIRTNMLNQVESYFLMNSQLLITELKVI